MERTRSQSNRPSIPKDEKSINKTHMVSAVGIVRGNTITNKAEKISVHKQSNRRRIEISVSMNTAHSTRTRENNVQKRQSVMAPHRTKCFYAHSSSIVHVPDGSKGSEQTEPRTKQTALRLEGREHVHTDRREGKST